MKYEVAVQVLTYNQKDYIAQCLDGIVTQRTTFPFVAVVHDDASTDGTADIVRQYAERYPDIIHPIFQTENQYSKGKSPAKIVAEKINEINPTYKCIVDGDDYWTDADFLQVCYDWLEEHPACAMAYTKTLVMEMPSGTIREKDAGHRWETPTLETMLIRNMIPIHTALFRMDVYRDYYQEVRPFEKPWPVNDWAIWLYMIAKHEVQFIDRTTAILRMTTVSMSRKKTLRERVKYLQGLKQLSLYFVGYSTQKDIRKKIRQHYNKRIYYEIADEMKSHRFGAVIYKALHFCISWIR